MHSTMHELVFPRKLENCTVYVYRGSECIGNVNTDTFDIWMLAPNVLKYTSLDSNYVIEHVDYNVTIQVVRKIGVKL